jgi:hypothetical protein
MVSYNAGKQIENPRVDFQITGVASPATGSSVYVIEIVHNGEVVVRSVVSAIQTPLSRLTEPRRERLLPSRMLA